MSLRWLVVMAGGALGALGRYAVSGWVARLTRQSPFPYGTLTVNVAGALVLGFLMSATTSGRLGLSQSTRILLGVGMLGAFTTFSTFTYETVEAARAGDLRGAVLNVVVSLVLGLSACWLGLKLGDRL